MFYILTFSYLVALIVPVVICLLVPGTFYECSLCLTYMSVYRNKKAKEKKRLEEDSEFKWRSNSALTERLNELVPQIFEKLYFLPGDCEQKENAPREYYAQVWLKQADRYLVDNVDTWEKVVNLRNDLEQIGQLYGQKLAEIEKKLLTAQKILFSYIFNEDGTPREYTIAERELLDKQQSLLNEYLERVKFIKALEL